METSSNKDFPQDKAYELALLLQPDTPSFNEDLRVRAGTAEQTFLMAKLD